MDSDTSFFTALISAIMIVILIGIAVGSAEETKEVQTCEFGNHHYICAECGEELANRYDAYNK